MVGTAFHRAVLTSGGVPLSLPDAVVDRYIAGTLAAPWTGCANIRRAAPANYRATCSPLHASRGDLNRLASLRAGLPRFRQERDLADADGILGVDGFEQMCLQADFTRNRISIARNGCPRMRRGWIRIPASLRFGRLIRIGAVIHNQRVHAVIDTGAARSLGNPALLRALSLERRADDPRSDTQVIGATSHETEGNLLVIPTLYLGKVGIRNMRVTFGNFNVFQLWDLVDEPAIVVGMDVLGTVDGLMIDYARVELRILPKGATGQSPPTGIRLDL